MGIQGVFQNSLVLKVGSKEVTLWGGGSRGRSRRAGSRDCVHKAEVTTIESGTQDRGGLVNCIKGGLDSLYLGSFSYGLR